jgi:hypothetical protein|tara:strand:- start:609 stop:1472 length:864 start_codon:yes stop_codon:yes gene_type:complete
MNNHEPIGLSEKLLNRGLRSVLSSIGSYYGDRDGEAKELAAQIVINPDVISEVYSDLCARDRIALFGIAKDNSIDLYSNSFWRGIIDGGIHSYESIGDNIMYGRESGVELMHMIEQKADMCLSNIFNLTIQSMESNKHNYASNTVCLLFDTHLKRNPSLFSEDVKKNFFDKKSKAGCSIRGKLYYMYASNGFLDKKAARKIRSDASAAASADGLKGLIKARDLDDCPYSESDVLNMILQFTDSRHEDVVIVLADNLPVHLLPSIMGTESRYAKRIMERRINEPMESE